MHFYGTVISIFSSTTSSAGEESSCKRLKRKNPGTELITYFIEILLIENKLYNLIPVEKLYLNFLFVPPGHYQTIPTIFAQGSIQTPSVY